MQYKHYVLRSLRMLTKRPECLLYVPPVEHNLNHIPDRVVLNLWLVEQFDAAVREQDLADIDQEIKDLKNQKLKVMSTKYRV